MALGGEVVEKYSTQRPDYQAYAEGDVVEDEIRKGMLSANPRLRQR